MPNATRQPPLVAVVGRKHSGKTTLVVRLAAELGARGHRVMTVKHGTHTFNIDPSTTDTYRHYHEGHVAKVAMVAPDKFALIERHTEEPTLDSIVRRHMADADVVLCEGFTGSALPKIEIFRRAAHATPRIAPESDEFRHVRAVVTDDAGLSLPIPVFSLSAPDWLAGLATLVERELMMTT
ncbi:MAG TPA: molybdopterin-guanine dinucleotide biosynthesis protein B [Gemmatimonadaceae bacterium]|nr:molybdopterin-guanine dinucleotide biosynthesis protein B [Gemmatimonadaceae bacterium]